jgi:hypothetical protein
MNNIEVPDTVRVWKIGVDQANVRSWNNYTNNQGYSLFCTTNKRYLTWVKVPIGVNLDFKSQGDNKTHFRLPDGQESKYSLASSSRSGLVVVHRSSITKGGQ